MGNWILSILQASMDFFSGKLQELFEILQADPMTYMDGAIWKEASKIYDLLLGSAYAILTICIYVEIVRASKDLVTAHRGESMLWFIFSISIYSAIMHGCKYILVWIIKIGQDLVGSVIGSSGSAALTFAWNIPGGIYNRMNGLKVMQQGFMFLIVLIAAIIIAVSAFTILLIGYGRLFNLYLHIAVAPIAFAFIPSELTRQHFMSFLRSFVGICLQALAIIAACMIFSAFSKGYEQKYLDSIQEVADVEREDNTNSVIDGINIAAGGAVGTVSDNAGDLLNDDGSFSLVWNYLLEQIFLFLLLAGAIKGSDQMVSKLFGT
ncbi:MAG: type IV secretion system protein [Lachnospiraceae bacterium]|nr:type IV secretion system protein [Lachnospiraceae bacterium]